MRLRAYAKVNLGLRVLRRREDGFHEVQGLMQTIGLADELVLEEGGRGIALEVRPPLGVPPEENLAYCAAESGLRAVGSTANLRIQLTKKIPAGAGLGGGSSDGAAVLVGVNELFRLGMDRAELMELAAELGSDVPFFLLGGTCSVGGRGEHIKKLPPLPRYQRVLLVPPFPLPTAEVYRKLDELGKDEENGGSPRPLRLLRNDLERAALALRPELVKYRGFLKETGPDFFGMSGSGPAWFAGFKERGRAEAAVEALELPGRAILTEFIDYGCEIG
ncbi:MAG: 4-(cytidine 5'-diphospho)-2-C-methyl-D-erythritol kinase [Candidatus Bipolaricaulia bacterium]